MKEYRKYAITLSIVGLLLILTGVTYSFFNYTRTGNINNLGTGRIYFNSVQSDTLSITNLFPMTGAEAGSANLDAVTISITGDTTYLDGEEFEITLVDINNIVNGKSIPLNYIATYTAANGGTIGTSNSDYWEDRNDKDASIYILNAAGQVKEGKQVLVGYNDNGGGGINGTLTIKAYIDADRIAISDTYYENAPTPTLSPMPSGVGKKDENCDNLIPSKITAPIPTPGPNDEYGTTIEWVNGRVVLTTDEWNSLVNTPLSFKIRAESNEGIWVEAPHAPTMDEMCPGCVFTYTTTLLYTTWNTDSQTPTVLTSSDYEENYEDVITSSGKNFFLGLKLNGSNQIEKAYACGLYNDETPFCIEGYYDNSKYEANQEILQNEYLWNNTCSVQTYDEGTEYEYEETYCASPSAGLVVTDARSYGRVDAGVDDGDNCRVDLVGEVYCHVG